MLDGAWRWSPRAQHQCAAHSLQVLPVTQRPACPAAGPGAALRAWITRKREHGQAGQPVGGSGGTGGHSAGRPHFLRGEEVLTWLSPADKKGQQGRNCPADRPRNQTGAAEPPAPGQEDERGQEWPCQVKRRQRQSGQGGPWPVGTQCPGLGRMAPAATCPGWGQLCRRRWDRQCPGQQWRERGRSSPAAESLSGLNENTCPAPAVLLALL